MALKLSFPIEKTFGLVTYQAEDGYTELRRAREGEQPEGYVTFRQASIAEAEERTGMASKRKYEATSAENYTILNDLNWDSLARLEVMLTLSATDIEYPDSRDEAGNPVYRAMEFYEPTGYKKVKSQNQFNKWWGTMRVQWGRVVHDCCLEVNPSWSMKS